MTSSSPATPLFGYANLSNSDRPGSRWSTSPTIGAEWELGLVDANTSALIPDGVPRIAADLERLHMPGKFHDELFANTIEAITGICPTVGDLTTELAQLRDQLQPIVRRHGMALSPLGSHPLSPPDSQLIMAGSPRREARVAFHGDALRQQNIWSVHFHVGLSGPDAAVGALREVAEWLPMLSALAASSPYWNGRDTGLESSRPMAYAGAPFSGPPPLVGSFAEYENLFDTLVTQGHGFVNHPKDLHWEARITQHGTLEVRMCDGLATTREIGAIGALIQALAVRGGERGPLPAGDALEAARIEGNRFQAMRYGIDAPMVDRDGRTATLRQRLPQLVAELTPLARELGAAEQLADLPTMAALGSSARRQRAAVQAANGKLRAAALLGVRELNADRILSRGMPSRGRELAS